MSRFKRVCVYCGSSNAVAPHYKEAATAVGRTLAERGIDVVFGGGRVGLMGAVADGALAAGGRVYGVIPEKLVAHELAHPGCTELFVVDGMHPRKLMMATLSDAFIALPGGWGTMEELFEVTTWAQLNYHLKPVGLLNQGGFYDPLLAWVQRAVDEGFIRPLHQGLVSHAADIDALLAAMEVHHVPRLGEWIDRV